MRFFKKLFGNKKIRMASILSINIAVLSAAVVLTTISWFSHDYSIGPVDYMKSSVTTWEGLFDKNDLPENFNETVYPHGCSANPFVITKPVHLWNLLRMYSSEDFHRNSPQDATFFCSSGTTFQFGKQFGMPQGLTEEQQAAYPYLFYKCDSNGDIISPAEYDNYLDMTRFQEENDPDEKCIPLGSAKYPFEGHILGNNLTVKNLYVVGKGYSDIGIFGYVGRDAYIQNLYFDDVTVDAGNAKANADGSVEHVSHGSHVYVGFLAGHIYNTSRFSDVYINNCHIKNTEESEYEMLNTFGFFGHTDEPMGSSSDTSGYTSQLVAANAYDALGFCKSLGGSSPLARRYTTEVAGSVSFNSAVSVSNNVYTVGQASNEKPYSISSIGYTSGNAGTFKHARYYDGQYWETIDNVEPENVLSEEPKYIEYPVDQYGRPLEPIDYSNDPDYRFYGMNDGDYIYYNDNDPNDSKWMYAKVTGDMERSSTGTVALNCHTISYQQTVNDVTRTYYLKYHQKSGSEKYDTIIAEEWYENTPPQTEEYYFCFKLSFGHNGVSRFTECSVDNEYYIFSPAAANLGRDAYLCTYAPQNVNSGNPKLSANHLHKPVLVPETGHTVSGNKKWYPTKFTIGGPKSQITYDAVDNKNTGAGRDVNEDFDSNVGKERTYKGALQGSNITNELDHNLFGGHKMNGNATGGLFTIGDYIETQTTSLNNAVNYKLTSNSSEIVENSTLVVAGYKGEQTSTYSIDYAMGSQMDNNRDAKTVREVRDSSGYVLNDTTGVVKLVFNIVGGTNNDPVFTLRTPDGFLAFPDNRAFSSGSGATGNNYLRSYTQEELDTMDNNKELAKHDFAKWKFSKFEQSGYYTRYRFQNYGNPDRYLCYNIGSNMFATYSLTEYLAKEAVAAAGATSFSNENVNMDLDGYPNARCWFYIYKQQHGQTIQNVHYTAARIFNITTTIYPFKNIVEYPLKVSDVNNSPTDYTKYTDFTVDPTFNVYFNTTTSQVQYFEAYVRVWKRVNLVSELMEGDTVMIGAQTTSGSGGSTPQHYFMGSQASNYRNRSSRVDFVPPYVQADNIPSNAYTFTLSRSDRGWRFDTGNGFLYAAGGSQSNYLRTETSADSNGNADFSISILTDGTANIISQGRNVTRNKIQYYAQSSWWGSGSGYFSCFSGNQTAVQLYRLAQSSADRSTYVGDLINNFEPLRMDAVGPNIEYHTDYMKMNQGPSIQGQNNLTVGQSFYPSLAFKNAITLLIDANGSRDLGTLKFECRVTNSSQLPYFYLNNGSQARLDLQGAVDKDPDATDNVRSYLLNINSLNINSLTYHYIKGSGVFGDEYKVCEANDENLSKYLVVLAAPSTVEITNVTFTFNAVPGNISYSGAVDYRSATYDNNGFFTGTIEGGQMVSETVLCIFYDVTAIGQNLGISVVYNNASTTYTITIDTSNTVLTEELTISIFKYDNTATTLIVVVDGISTQYDEGAITITLSPNSP